MSYRVDIERLGPSAIIDLQGSPPRIRDWIGDALPPFPEIPNTASASNGLELYWIGRERWLLRGDIGRENDLLARARPAAAPLEISVVPVSDTLEFFALTGPEAGEVVSIASPLDHHPRVFPENGASYTELFGVKGLLVRRSRGFELGVERSFGDMLEDFLVRARA